MAHNCLKFLKYSMCFANLLCFICGVGVLGFGIYMTMTFQIASLTPTLTTFSISNMLLITGIVISCVSFLGFLGALKENRCLLLMFFLLLFILMVVELIGAGVLLMNNDTISDSIKKDLLEGLESAKNNSTEAMQDWDVVQSKLKCCGVSNATDWGNEVPKSCCTKECPTTQPPYWPKGCLEKLLHWFEENFLTAGIAVIILCVIEVLGMSFAMTLFCHINRSGLGRKY